MINTENYSKRWVRACMYMHTFADREVGGSLRMRAVLLVFYWHLSHSGSKFLSKCGIRNVNNWLLFKNQFYLRNKWVWGLQLFDICRCLVYLDNVIEIFLNIELVTSEKWSKKKLFWKIWMSKIFLGYLIWVVPWFLVLFYFLHSLHSDQSSSTNFS